MTYPRTRVWFGPGTDAALLFSSFMGFSSVVMATINCHGAGG